MLYQKRITITRFLRIIMIQSFLFLILCVIQLPAWANGSKAFFDQVFPHQFHYQYADFQAVHNLDSGSGFNLTASFPVKPNLAVMTEFHYLASTQQKNTLITGGVQYFFQANNNFSDDLDIALQAQLEQSIITGDVPSKSHFGLRLGTVVQLQLDDDWRAITTITLATTNKSTFSIEPGLLYQLTDQLFIKGGIRFSDENKLNLGIRFQF